MSQDTTLVQQRAMALKKGNEIRAKRAREKTVLGNGGGRDLAVKLLTEVPSYWESAPVEQLLTSVRGIGKVKARVICQRLGLSPSKSLGDLSATTRMRISERITR